MSGTIATDMLATVTRSALMAVFVTAGCSTASINLTPLDPTDLTVPARVNRRFGTIMVLPPFGSERGAASALAEVERVLLDGGVRVISSGVTGRVVRDQTGDRVESAANLSDLERALVLARGSNAEALLQILEIGWVQGERSFVLDQDRFDEVGHGISVNSSALVQVGEAIFKFQARLISVDNGEILMNIEILQGTSRVSPPQKLDVTSSPLNGMSRHFIDTDGPDRRQTVVSQVMAAFLSRLSQGTASPAPLGSYERVAEPKK
jgi:hypothetical protein